MKSKTIGQILRDEREAHRLTLEKLSASTQIRLEFLEALEADRFDELPSAAYVKGFIQAYCREFGLESGALLAILRRDYKASAKGQLIPREFIKPVRRRPIRWTPITWLLLFALLLGSAFFSYLGFQWYRLTRPPELVVLEPTARATVSAKVQVSGYTSPEAMLEINDELVSVQPDGHFSTTLNFPVEGLGIISLTASNRQGRVQTEQRLVYVQF